jgi:hypothetical protein
LTSATAASISGATFLASAKSCSVNSLFNWSPPIDAATSSCLRLRFAGNKALLAFCFAANKEQTNATLALFARVCQLETWQANSLYFLAKLTPIPQNKKEQS